MANRPRVGAAPTGFDVLPDRSPATTFVLLVAVVIAAAGFAHLFRESALWIIERYAGHREPTRAAESLAWPFLTAVVIAAVIVAVVLGRVVLRGSSTRIGLEAVAASARGEDRRLSLPATLVRSTATWLVACGLVSIGRESAIVETGGAIGAAAGRWRRGRGDALAAAGIAAAFATAYHAPLAAIFYVEEHLRVGRNRRALGFTVAGAAGGHIVAVTAFDGDALLPGIDGSRLGLIVLSGLCLLPAVVAGRGFLEFRDRITGAAFDARRRRWRWTAVVAMACIAGLTVAITPMAAGNGMDALRNASTNATIGLALALAVGKLASTGSALAAGVPGGILFPTIGIAAGWALLAYLAADAAGVGVAHPWDAMVAAMAIGVAVGLRSPLVAV
ncbi:MAG TPA: chloride channel protein, partial [Ilumatobacteraceae bacterium]|nr:chloride channel protein [Ilumatobacteraceae bacterium]